MMAEPQPSIIPQPGVLIGSELRLPWKITRLGDAPNGRDPQCSERNLLRDLW